MGRLSGSTFDPGEHWYQYDGNVWYRWTAPEDGLSIFKVSDSHEIHVYTGTAISDIRPVSYGLFRNSAVIQVRKGQTYHIAITLRSDCDSDRGEFSLEWSSDPVFDYGVAENDHFEDAVPLRGV